MLLGMKKRGFGMGKWNGFGGKVAEGEAVEDAAKRELHEEAGVTAMDLAKLGVLDFSWQENPGDILRVHIFKCTQFEGEPAESEEMKPQWFKVAEIPFAQMWSDDIHWMPMFLEGKQFKGYFVFGSDNNVVEHELKEI